MGARIALQDVLDRDGVDLFTALFSETQGRAVVSVPRSEEVRFKDMCTARGFEHLRIGVVDAASGQLEINGVDTLVPGRPPRSPRGHPAEVLRLTTPIDCSVAALLTRQNGSYGAIVV